MSDVLADVVVIGSGVAGSLAAAELAPRGVKVAILEAGARVDRQEGVERFWQAANKVPESPYPPVPQAMHPVTTDLGSWYRQAGPEMFRSTYLKAVGGTTWHWLGTALRYLPNDFQLRTLYGRGVDWPIGYEELEPFYAQAEAELGVAGDDSDDLGSPRSGRYPMPPVGQTFLDRQLARALEGSAFRLRPTPQARNVVERDGARLAAAARAAFPSARSRRSMTQRSTWRRQSPPAPNSMSGRPPPSWRPGRMVALQRFTSDAGMAARGLPGARSSCSPPMP